MKHVPYMVGTVTFDGPGGSDIARKVERLMKTGRDQDRSQALRLIKEHATEADYHFEIRDEEPTT